MSIRFVEITVDQIGCLKGLCDDLMAYQKSVAQIRPELFDGMCFETRLVPSVNKAKANHIVTAWDGENIVGYVYSNISSKEVYSSDFAVFFDMESVARDEVGCLSQFYIKEGYRNRGIGSVLFQKSMEWLHSFPAIEDLFIFVSNGNDNALNFYLRKGFQASHHILGGFITVLRNNVQNIRS